MGSCCVTRSIKHNSFVVVFHILFLIFYVHICSYQKLNLGFSILSVGKDKFVVRIYTIKSYKTMTHRCRVQHRWTEQINLFIGILPYVLSYNFSFYIGQSYIKHFTIKRANNVRPYDCEPKFCYNSHLQTLIYQTNLYPQTKLKNQICKVYSY